MLPRRFDDLVVVLKRDHRCYPVLLESVDVLVSLLDPDRKYFQRRRVCDAGNVVAKKDGGFDRGIWRSEIKVVPALGRLDDGVDHVELAGPHAAQRFAPVHCVDLDLDPRLLFPRVPLIDQDALQLAFVRLKRVRRVSVIQHDSDDSRRLGGSLRQNHGRNQRQPNNKSAQYSQGFDHRECIGITKWYLKSRNRALVSTSPTDGG